MSKAIGLGLITTAVVFVILSLIADRETKEGGAVLFWSAVIGVGVVLLAYD